MPPGKSKNLLANNAIRVLIVFLASLAVTVAVNSTSPHLVLELNGQEVLDLQVESLPLLLEDRKRPAVTAGDWKGTLDYIDLAEIEDRIAAGEVAFVDGRDRQEFDASHAPGAFNLSSYDQDFEEAFDAFVDEVEMDRFVVIFAQGKLFAESARLAKLLSDEGYEHLAICKQSFQDWKALNRPVESEISESDTPHADQ